MGFDIGARLGFHLGPHGCAACPVEMGAAPAGVVAGIEGVKESLVRLLSKDPEQMLLQDVAVALASLDRPEAWTAHGFGDGQPCSHWWFGYAGGSVTAQRLTEPLPSDRTAYRLRSRLDEVAGALTDIADDLCRFADVQQKRYAFTQGQPG